MVLRRIRSRHPQPCGAPRAAAGATNDRRPRTGGQPVHDRRLGAATSVPLPERQRDAPDSSRSNDQRVLGILIDSAWNGIELQPLDIACAMPQRKLVSCDRSGRRGAQNADKRTRAQVHGDEVHFIAACGW
jgi:hypothetical protein